MCQQVDGIYNETFLCDTCFVSSEETKNAEGMITQNLAQNEPSGHVHNAIPIVDVTGITETTVAKETNVTASVTVSEKNPTNYFVDDSSVVTGVAQKSYHKTNLKTSWKIPKLKESKDNINIQKPEKMTLKPFQSCNLEALPTYDVPDEFVEIENGENTSIFGKMINLVEDGRKNEEKYLQLVESMLHLEESANAASISIFDRKYIVLKLSSLTEQVFEVNWDVSHYIILFIYLSILLH